MGSDGNNGQYSVGIETTTPVYDLAVEGTRGIHTTTFTFTGGFLPNGAAGTSGQFLQSNGPGATPTWATPSGSGRCCKASTQVFTGGTPLSPQLHSQDQWSFLPPSSPEDRRHRRPGPDLQWDSGASLLGDSVRRCGIDHAQHGQRDHGWRDGFQLYNQRIQRKPIYSGDRQSPSHQSKRRDQRR